MDKDLTKYELLRQMLIDERNNAQLKQADVAAKLGKPQSYISKIERGERGIDVIEFFELAEVIGFDSFNFMQRFLDSFQK